MTNILNRMKNRRERLEQLRIDRQNTLNQLKGDENVHVRGFDSMTREEVIQWWFENSIYMGNIRNPEYSMFHDIPLHNRISNPDLEMDMSTHRKDTRTMYRRLKEMDYEGKNHRIILNDPLCSRVGMDELWESVMKSVMDECLSKEELSSQGFFFHLYDLRGNIQFFSNRRVVGV